MDESDESRWQFADAWVFTAIGIHQRPCSLAEVVAAGDAVNHALLLESEIQHALGTLTGAGLLEIRDNWTFELTEQGKALFSRGRGGLIGQVRSVSKLLAAIAPGTALVRLPTGAVDQATKEYLKRPRLL